jgi:NAD-dependent SIR2 family protein deacetylase
LQQSSESTITHAGSANCGDPKCQRCKLKRPFDLPSEVVEACNRGRLVIFAGAGVSTESKSVYRSRFYAAIKEELGIKNDNVSFSKLMSLYCSVKSRKDLLLAIKERIDYVKAFPELYQGATEFHRELSTVPHIHEIFTTNWDDFFERECGAVPVVTGEDYAIFQDIPGRRVFKIHGSIYNYGSIVATEEDYNQCYRRLSSGLIGAKLKAGDT